MGQFLEIVTPLHQATQRDYLARMQDEKVHCMQIAKQYESDYWDGDRRYGYGGYKYDGRWKAVAEQLIEIYDLQSNAKILDINIVKDTLNFPKLDMIILFHVLEHIIEPVTFLKKLKKLLKISKFSISQS